MNNFEGDVEHRLEANSTNSALASKAHIFTLELSLST